MFIYNLEFGAVGWYPPCQVDRFFSLVYRATPGSGPLVFRQAFDALRGMPKP
ncbi:MAG: hypothetical protein HY329_11735 [Chloroflexi bacterium]|nr:hypothetical protein [Chloroflexota bacterium]